MANLQSTTITGQLNVTQSGTSINSSSNIVSGNITITQNAAVGNLNVSTRSFEGNLNVYFTANVTNGNIIANSYQYNAPTTLALTPGAGTTANVGTTYMKNVANAMFVFSTYPYANNTNYNLDVPFQSHHGYRTRYLIQPGSNGANTSPTNTQCLAIDGGILVNVSANAQTALWPTNASPILKNSMRRLQLNANSTLLANANAFLFGNANTVWTGNGAGSGNGGGFLFVSTVSIDTFANNNTHYFTGMSNLLSTVTGNLDPRTNTIYGMWGIGSNSNTGNWQIIAGPAGAARNVTDLGVTFAVNTNDVLELTLISPPAGATLGYRVRNLTNGGETQGVFTTNTPTANIFIQPYTYIIGNTVAGAVTLNAQISIIRQYLEPFY